MSALPVDWTKYRGLVAKALPAVITSATEHTRVLNQVEHLMMKGDAKRSAEEERLLATLIVLVTEFGGPEPWRRIRGPARRLLPVHELHRLLDRGTAGMADLPCRALRLHKGSGE